MQQKVYKGEIAIYILRRGFETNSNQPLNTLILSLVLAFLLIIGTFDVSLVFAAPTKVATPTFIPVSGTYSSPQNVTVQCATPGAIIRYTTVGSVPLTVYSSPIMVNVTTTVIAKAFMDGMADSNTASATYTIKVATPSFNPAGGNYSSAQNVVLSCATSGATITYTTNGSEPSSSSTAYSSSSPITVSANLTVKAKAFMSGMADSNTASATYTINIPPPKVATPTFSPSGGTYSSSQNVALSCSTSGASIRYTTDGSEPGS